MLAWDAKREMRWRPTLLLMQQKSFRFLVENSEYWVKLKLVKLLCVQNKHARIYAEHKNIKKRKGIFGLQKKKKETQTEIE